MVKSSPPSNSGFLAPARPRFNSQRTSDRLREAQTFVTPPFKMGGAIRKGRRSVFKEVGLEHDLDYPASASTSAPSLLASEQLDTQHSDQHSPNKRTFEQDSDSNQQRPRQSSLSSPWTWYAKLSNPKGRPRIKSTTGTASSISGLQRFTMLAVLIAVILPAFSWRNGQSFSDVNGASAGVIKKRETSPTEVCARWGLQAAQLNGTLYLYGGRSRSKADQTEDTWNNNFLTLDLTKDWDIDSPSLKGLEKPSGPPEVSMGYLWHDYNNLYLYGGQFSDAPYVDPEPESVWRYSIKDEEWTEFKNPKTSAGNESEPGDRPVHRAAEGAGISVPELGLSWYFGGHLDWATTPSWPRSVERVYLKSLLEFTHPGYVNTGVDNLSEGTGAGDSGAYRNITEAA
jgi:hypothetical protein